EEPRERDANKTVALVVACIRVGWHIRQLDVVEDFGSRRVFLADLFGPDPFEEGVDTPEVRLLPVIRGMVVALRALDLLAEENAGGGRRPGHGTHLEVRDGVVDRAVVLVRSLGRNQIEGELVPGPVRVELLPKP